MSFQALVTDELGGTVVDQLHRITIPVLFLTGEFDCSADNGDSWRPMNPTYEMPELSQLKDFDFAADGGIWGATLNEVVRPPPI